MEIAQHTIEVAGLPVHYRQAGDAPVVYLHGVPTQSSDWNPFLERIGGTAPDLPGFGRSAKPGDFDYSIAGYDRFLEQFLDELGLERVSLVMHDWGAVGLALAQRLPERIERLVLFPVVPFVPGYRWHRVARGWRTPLLGELLMGFTRRWSLRRELPRELADEAWEAFDHGTQRAILRLYRSSPPDVLARAGERLGDVRAPALILWTTDDPYIPAKFGELHGDALGGEVTLELVDGGHWPWFGRPELVERAAEFLRA
ncbi:MAG TPA: alpha/beta fold hydrolase [Thermoleophilaceae bacterium]|nr:alpha/beta fold hydrolase [Thermoleophilaceae bacterium]